MGVGRSFGGSCLGGGAGGFISSTSGERERYMERRESLADVWREPLSEPAFFSGAGAADFLGGSGVFKLMVVYCASAGDGSAVSVGCLTTGERVSRRGAGRLGEAPGMRGDEGRVFFLKAGSGTVIIAFSSATGVI